MIFVTGATGLLGSHLIQSLLQQNLPVRALYREEIPKFSGVEHVEWVQGDILDVASLNAAMQGVEQVYHCAAVVSYQPADRDILYKTNVEGTANVVNEGLNVGIKKLLHVSSVSALGHSVKDNLVDENVPWTVQGKSSYYGETKQMAEMEIWRGIGEGLEAVIINPTIILGHGNWDSGSSQIFKTVYNEFPWYSDGVTGFVDVVDVVHAAELLMNSDVSSDRFIISAENRKFQDVFDMIAECFNKNKPHKKVTPLLASLIWRSEVARSLFTRKNPLLTKETAANAQSKIYYNNQKFLNCFHNFSYQPLQKTIHRICQQYKFDLNLQ